MRSASSAARSGPSAGRILLVAGLLIIGAGIGIGALLAEHEPGTPETPGGYVAEPTLTWSPDETLFLDEATLPVEPTAEAVAVELRNAIDEGLVSAKGIGDGLERLDLELTSRSDQNLLVTVDVGTVLAPRASSTQNMVVVREASIELVPDATETLELDVACAQMHDDQPSGKDSFKVQMLDPKADLLKLLRLDTFGDETFRVQQFAIWTITDNPPRGGYQGLGTTFDIYGTGPTSKELGRIKALFEDAGISTGHYRALS